MKLYWKVTKQVEVKRIEEQTVECGADIPSFIDDAVRELVQSRKKIAAIKLVRAYATRTNFEGQLCGLKEAKDYVEWTTRGESY